jgi:glycosyltransferase involved in cell wall biosynthesis
MTKKVAKHILSSGNKYLAGMLFVVILTLGVIFSHNSFLEMAGILLLATTLAFFFFKLLKALNVDWYVIARNFIDFVEVLIPVEAPKEKTTGDKKRILIFNWRDTKHVYAGGAEVYIHELASRWVKEGYTVTLFCGNDGKNPRHEVYDGVEVIRHGGFYFVYVWAFIYYILRLRKSTDIVIDAQNGIPFFTPLYVRKPIYCLMFHVHQDYLRTSLIHPLYLLAYFLEQKAMPFIYKHISFMTISESTKKDMEKLGLGKTGIDIIFPGVNLNKLNPGKKTEAPTILYLGRLKSYKSVHVLIKAAPAIIKKFPKVTFVIAGFGEEEKKLKKLAKKLDVFNKFSFLGKVTEEEKIALYQKSWVFVNPSLIEGWGITTIEANACGTPVVASNVPGLRDSVQNPHTGFLVEYGNTDAFAEKIISLLDDKQMLKVMSHEAIAWSEKFDWNKSAQKGLQILQKTGA